MERLDPGACAVLLVDVQERLSAAMEPQAMERLLKATLVLLDAAKALGVPVVASEQYPKGLGPTVAPIAAKLHERGVTPIDKVTFDACEEPRIAAALAQTSARAVVIAGVEAHVCVFQTARELAKKGIDVRVVADAVASRQTENRVVGLGVCERAGAVAMPMESVVFDWLRKAGTDDFRFLSKLLR
jgi:nicotinamidase-related amidase